MFPEIIHQCHRTLRRSRGTHKACLYLRNDGDDIRIPGHHRTESHSPQDSLDLRKDTHIFVYRILHLPCSLISTISRFCFRRQRYHRSFSRWRKTRDHVHIFLSHDMDEEKEEDLFETQCTKRSSCSIPYSRLLLPSALTDLMTGRSSATHKSVVMNINPPCHHMPYQSGVRAHGEVHAWVDSTHCC
jgi:hypothetical protein